MKYKYDLYATATMSNQEMLDALLAREIAPRTIVGTGYKNGRKVAIDYLKEMIAKENAEKIVKCMDCSEDTEYLKENVNLARCHECRE